MRENRQNRAGLSHRVWLTLIALLLCAGALWAALSGSQEAAMAAQSGSAPMVLQGHVIDVQKDSITIRTPDIRPTPEPGKVMPMFIMAGETYKADISGAVFESPTGRPNAQNDLKAGDPVVVVCAPINPSEKNSGRQPWPVIASVVEKLQPRLAP